MKNHITVNGKPYCQCRPEHLFPHSEDALGAHFKLQDRALRQGLFVVCMGSQPTTEEAVKFLNDNGIPARIAAGACPTWQEVPDPQP